MRCNARTIQIVEALAAEPADNNSPRKPGMVRFRISLPDEDSTALVPDAEHTLTQDDFVRFLITGVVEDKLDVKAAH